MIFEIVNPSDYYTMETDDFEVAAVACLIIGRGQYGLKQLDGGFEVPIFFIANEDIVNQWFRNRFCSDLGICLKRVKVDKKDALIKCLNSVLVGKDRNLYFEGLRLIKDGVGQKEWQEKWHDEHRTSLNDIGRCSWGYAKQLMEA
jgi:hypothetical protein